MTNKRLILHIGDSKTGSSALQRVLATQGDRLKDAGLIYAQSGKSAPNAINQVMLPKSLFACTAPTRLRDLKPWADLREEIARLPDGMSLCASNEGLAGISRPWQAEALAEFAQEANCTIRIVGVYRKPVSWIVSLYNQMVKAPPFARQHGDRFVATATLRIYASAPILAEVLGKDSIELVPYGPDVVDRTLACLGLEPAEDAQLPVAPKTRENASLPAELTAAFRCLNDLKFPDHIRRELYATIRQCWEEHGSRHPRDLNSYEISEESKALFVNRNLPTLIAFCNYFGVNMADLID